MLIFVSADDTDIFCGSFNAYTCIQYDDDCNTNFYIQAYICVCICVIKMSFNVFFELKFERKQRAELLFFQL